MFDGDEFDEDKLTFKYMYKYGINNVRGGSFCEFILKYKDKFFIQKIIRNAMNDCFICGSHDHYADCHNYLSQNEKIIKKVKNNHITSFGNIITSNNKINVLNKKLDDFIISQIKKFNFKSIHYSGLKIELIDYINIIN